MMNHKTRSLCVSLRAAGKAMGFGSQAKIAGTVVAIALCSTIVPAAAQTNGRAISRAHSITTDHLRGPDAYIYVSDADEHKVYVYPVGVTDPQPLRVISVPGNPSGMAVADNGDVFVAMNNEVTEVGEVMIYSAGGTRLVGSLGSTSGIASIRDVALDAAGNLYVSCENTSSGSTGVMEFAPTLQRSVAWYPSPTSQSYGITVDERDNLFVDLGFYGTAIEFSRATPNVYAVAAINGAPSAGGIVFSEGNLIMSGGTGLWIFSPSPPASKFAFTLAGYIDYGVGHATGYLARGRDGTLYVPVYGSSGGHSPVHEVRVYRQSADKPFQDRIYSTLSAGLQEPSGVALGPR